MLHWRGAGVVKWPPSEVQDQRAEAPESHGQADRESDPVFCFLPVRPVGFRFSLHAPWSLTSNREDFHLEDPRNVWLRGVAADALAEAIARFGSEPGTNVLTLLDARRVLEPFWRRLLEEAVERIGDAPVVAVVGESKLYRPSEVLVPTPSLVRCTAAMRFIHALPAESWPAATGKRLARLSANEDVAVEDVRRLLSLHAEPVSAHKMRVLLNSDSVKAELTKHCRSRNPLGLAQLCELLSAMLAATQREPEKVPTFSEAGELPGASDAACVRARGLARKQHVPQRAPVQGMKGSRMLSQKSSRCRPCALALNHSCEEGCVAQVLPLATAGSVLP